MKLWMRFYEEDDEDCKDGRKWWLAYTPNFDAVTQGETLEEARVMAADLLVCHLEDTWGENQEVPCREPADRHLPGWEEVEVPQKAILALSIKRARLAQSGTMKDAAEKLGVSIGTYQRWENPYKFNATLETLQNVAKALGKRLEVSLV